MLDRCLYLVAVLVVAWAVTFALRALPFLLFAGHDQTLPPWVERLGNIVSPVIIAGLIFYSYSGLEWRTAWPYLAGLLTVGLQIWKRNPLVSILAGTVAYMCLLNCGCVTERALELDPSHPAVRVAVSGVYFGEKRVEPSQVVEILQENQVPFDRTIHILIEPKALYNLSDARLLMATLAKAGYTRPVLVTKRHGEAVTIEKPEEPQTDEKNGRSARPASRHGMSSGKRVIRYKKANE